MIPSFGGRCCCDVTWRRRRRRKSLGLNQSLTLSPFHSYVFQFQIGDFGFQIWFNFTHYLSGHVFGIIGFLRCSIIFVNFFIKKMLNHLKKKCQVAIELAMKVTILTIINKMTNSTNFLTWGTNSSDKVGFEVVKYNFFGILDGNALKNMLYWWLKSYKKMVFYSMSPSSSY